MIQSWSPDKGRTTMTVYQNCKVGDVQAVILHSGDGHGYGFSILSGNSRPRRLPRGTTPIRHGPAWRRWSKRPLRLCRRVGGSRSGGCRPPPQLWAKGNGRRRRVGERGRSERALTPRRQCAKLPLSSIRSGAHRYEGWHVTRACFSQPKTCQYPPFVMPPPSDNVIELRRTEA